MEIVLQYEALLSDGTENKIQEYKSTYSAILTCDVCIMQRNSTTKHNLPGVECL
jgi:hypothetical protein